MFVGRGGNIVCAHVYLDKDLIVHSMRNIAVSMCLKHFEILAVTEALFLT